MALQKIILLSSIFVLFSGKNTVHLYLFSEKIYIKIKFMLKINTCQWGKKKQEGKQDYFLY